VRKAITLAAVAAGAVLALAACGLDHGTVTGKHYHPSFTYYTTQCFSYSTKGVCTMSLPVPVTESARWELDLRDGDKTGSTYVDEHTWDTTRVGSLYP
jgi:hypothetical protein